MGDDEGHDALGFGVVPPEGDSHDDVADECSVALVEMIGASEDSAKHCGCAWPEACAGEPVKQVGNDDDFFEDAVFGGVQDEDGDGPPVVIEGCWDDLGGDAEGSPGEVQAQSWDADEGCESHSVREVFEGGLHVASDGTPHARQVLVEEEYR